jgi:hypothetical protein
MNTEIFVDPRYATSKNIESIAQQIWETTHDLDVDPEIRNQNMEILLGICLAHLFEYKKLLVSKEVL